MKLISVIKLDKTNTATSKKFDDDVMLENYDAIVIAANFWPIWSNTEAKFRANDLQSLHFHKQ